MFVFQFLNDKIHNYVDQIKYNRECYYSKIYNYVLFEIIVNFIIHSYVLFDIIVNFIIQKLKKTTLSSKSIQTEQLYFLRKVCLFFYV